MEAIALPTELPEFPREARAGIEPATHSLVTLWPFGSVKRPEFVALVNEWPDEGDILEG